MPSRRSPAPARRGVSRLYATEPVGVVDQPEFRNAVVALDVPGGPDPETGALALLIALKGIERAFGRQERERWGRASSTSTCSSSAATGSTSNDRRGPFGGPVEADRPRRPASARRGAAVRPCPARRPRTGLVPPGWTETVDGAGPSGAEERRRGPSAVGRARVVPANGDRRQRVSPRSRPDPRGTPGSGIGDTAAAVPRNTSARHRRLRSPAARPVGQSRWTRPRCGRRGSAG